MPIFNNKYILINIPGTDIDFLSDLFDKQFDSLLIGKDKKGRCLDHLPMDNIKINTTSRIFLNWVQFTKKSVIEFIRLYFSKT